MARTRSLASIEAEHSKVSAALKAARKEAAEKLRRDGDRRAVLLGAALLGQLPPEELTKLVKRVVPGSVKAKADLALFAEWLDATEPG